MSEVKRLPDADGWWWRRGEKKPLRVRIYHGRAQWQYRPYGSEWYALTPGEYLPCSEPEWPPEPPPRPQMVWASLYAKKPAWWVLRGAMWDDGCLRVEAELITPHDHPEQSAEESRRILEEEKTS